MVEYANRVRYSRRQAFGYVVLRLVVFGSLVTAFLWVRAGETNHGNRVALLVLALLLTTLGVVMVGQVAYGAVRGFRPEKVRP